MKCPHCLTDFHDEWESEELVRDTDFRWRVRYTTCPACERAIIELFGIRGHGQGDASWVETKEIMAYPRGVARAKLSPDIPRAYADAFQEAAAVLDVSPKASAALSRRLLQHLFHEHLRIKKRDLATEIDAVLPQLPPYLAEDVDAIRNIGNFAAHPLKSTNTGEIVDVEEGEADWLLNTLEGLFDFYFVQPAARKRRRDALDQKLADTNKPPMKTNQGG